MSEITFYMSFSELCASQQVSQQAVLSAIDYGIASPVDSLHSEDMLFDTQNIYWIKKAINLNQQFEIDWIATALVIKLLKQNEQLAKENNDLKQIIGRYITEDN